MIKLSWRNIWRNRQRTIVTMASVFFAAFFCIIESSFEEGVWDRMLENMLTTQTGHIQIHGKDYWEDKVIDNFMFMDTATIRQLEGIENVTNVSPRVETFAMASFEAVNKGIAVIGISPEKEAQKSNLPSRIVHGNYLSEDDNGILIGEGLSNYLNANIGDTLVLIGQGYHGASAAQLFAVRGIVKLMSSEMDNGMAYITLPAAQQFIDMPDGYSGILISLNNNNRLDETIKVVNSLVNNPITTDKDISENSALHSKLYTLNSNNYAVYSWHFTMERMLQTGESNRAFSMFLLCIMYLIVGFGILGTVIMMTTERVREFCVMVSLGMPRMRLAVVVSIELLIKSLIGVVMAIAVTLPITYWFHTNPIRISGMMAHTYIQFGMEPVLPMAVDSYIFINQIITIFIISLFTMI
jgi:ABC-type lipoprotein release transport system permease subunit